MSRRWTRRHCGSGLTVVRPEELPWIEQVRLFASAHLIVGEYGSGMHNALFSPAGAKVVCLNVVNELQARIGNAFGHDVGYLLDPDGAPRLFQGGWETQQRLPDRPCGLRGAGRAVGCAVLSL